MDLGLILGLVGTWVLIVWAIFSGGQLDLFWHTPSMALVVGGTAGILLLSFPIKTLKTIVASWNRVFYPRDLSIQKLIHDMVLYAEAARRDGILSLEKMADEIEDAFFARGMRMVVDGADAELIEQIMNDELDAMIRRHDDSRSVFETAGRYGPALGMIGTLIGLVIMLKNMNDPASIGPGMAIALLTTLYGTLLSNAVFNPLSDRLAKRSAEEVLYKSIIIKGVLAIQEGGNPRIVEQRLKAFVPTGVEYQKPAAGVVPAEPDVAGRDPEIGLAGMGIPVSA